MITGMSHWHLVLFPLYVRIKITDDCLNPGETWADKDLTLE
jgi:hypothetical protein